MAETESESSAKAVGSPSPERKKVRVFITFAKADVGYAKNLSKYLREFDFDARSIDEMFVTGDPIEEQIKRELLAADAMVALWSQASDTRNYLLKEVSFFEGASPQKPLFPVILDDSPIPFDLSKRVCLLAKDTHPEEVAIQIAQVLGRFEGQQTKEKQVAEVRKQEVEREADKYIAQSLLALQRREQKYQWLAFAGYFIGYVTIIFGLAIAIYRVLHATPTLGDLPAAVYTGVLTLSVIGFLAAAAKYAFVLGRSFMVEALRNNDRTHAIKFGQFYLKAFTEKVTWTELKEAFQYWNADTGSAFKEQKEQEIDPQTIKALTSLIESFKK